MFIIVCSFGISFIVYLLNLLIERITTAAVWCNIYLKCMYFVLATLYLYSFVLFFSWLWTTCIWCFSTSLFALIPFLGIKCFLWTFKVSPRAIIQVRIYLWQLINSTQCIYVASNLEMLNEKQTGGVDRRSKKVELQNTPTDCVIATKIPQKVKVSCFELPKWTQNELHFSLI